MILIREVFDRQFAFRFVRLNDRVTDSVLAKSGDQFPWPPVPEFCFSSRAGGITADDEPLETGDLQPAKQRGALGQNR